MTERRSPADDTGRDDPAGRRSSGRRCRTSAGATRSPWIGRAVFVVVAVALVAVARRSSTTRRATRQWAEYLCYAMIAVGIDIAWGYGGMLALGQGVFFGLGAYAMGMYLSLEQVGPTARCPSSCRSTATTTDAAAGLEAVRAPLVQRRAGRGARSRCCVAGALGWLVFSRRIRGPYFALLTQATALDLHADPGRPAEDSRRHQRPHQLPDRVRPQQVRAGHEQVPLLRRRRSCCSSCSSIALPPRAQPLRPAARGRPRRRGPRALPRLRPGRRQDVRRSSSSAGMAGARRRARRADHRHRRARTSSASLPSILMVVLGRRRRPRHAVRRGHRGAPRQLGHDVASASSWPDDWQYLQGLLFVVVVAFVPGGIVGLVARLIRRRAVRVGARTPAHAGVAPTGERAATDGHWWRHDRRRCSSCAASSSTSTGSRPSTASTSTIERGRAALPHRPERRRQDDRSIDVITGLTKPTEGEITFDGQLDRRACRRAEAGAPRASVAASRRRRCSSR